MKPLKKIWARSVLPLVIDGETRVQEKALESTDQLVLRSLAGPESQQGWTLLEVIIEQSLHIYLSKAIEMWSRQQQIPAQLLRALLSNSMQTLTTTLRYLNSLSFYFLKRPQIIFFYNYTYICRNLPSIISKNTLDPQTRGMFTVHSKYSK